jgi:hypothetical protein
MLRKPILAHKNLKNVKSLTQYQVKIPNLKPKLITIIGETHNDFNKYTASDAINITDYITQKYLTDPYIKLVLEYSPSVTDLKYIGSQSIQHLSMNFKYKYIFTPVDYRLDFLGVENLNNLYYGIPPPSKDLFVNYIKPFFDKFNEIFRKIEPNFIIDLNERKYLDLYLKSIADEFADITTLISISSRLDMIYPRLMANWSRIPEYFTLKEIFNRKNDDINEYIIIVGDAHVKNWESIFKDFPILIQKKDNSNVCLCDTY